MILSGAPVSTFHVEFFELVRVALDPRERQFLAPFLGVAILGLDVDRALEVERFVETVQLVLDRLRGHI